MGPANFADGNQRQHGKHCESYYHRATPHSCPMALYDCCKSFSRSNGAHPSRSLGRAQPNQRARLVPFAFSIQNLNLQFRHAGAQGD
jgi:hypothetical protein